MKKPTTSLVKRILSLILAIIMAAGVVQPALELQAMNVGQTQMHGHSAHNFTVPNSGYYLIEVWTAMEGLGTGSPAVQCGIAQRAYGVFELIEGQTLNIFVGSEGATGVDLGNNGANPAGGTNGSGGGGHGGASAFGVSDGGRGGA